MHLALGPSPFVVQTLVGHVLGENECTNLYVDMLKWCDWPLHNGDVNYTDYIMAHNNQ